MLDTDTGEMEEKTLEHEGDSVREFYSALRGPILVGIEATGSMQWFLELMEELGIECHVGHPQKIRKAETRKQKHDRRDARLLLTLLAENRFPTIWMPSSEQRDLRTLLRHRHQWVRLRSRVQHTLQSWHSTTVSGKATRYGAKQASTHFGHCLWLLMPVSAEPHCCLCTLACRNPSTSWINGSANRSSNIPRRGG
jgi:transposase